MTMTITMAEVQDRPLTEILRQVAAKQDTLRILLPEGGAVEIRPSPVVALQPLIRLEGSVPNGWKDAIYGE